MTSRITVNRPFITSFNFNSALFHSSRLEQINKLSRNFVVSLDLGSPNMKLVRHVGLGIDTKGKDAREKYLIWVKTWKEIYKELSLLIRVLKSFRKTVRFPKLNSQQLALFESAHFGTNNSVEEIGNTLSEQHLQRLQETAQVLLNARYNAKLAAAEARRRSL